eukprot:g18779.t1
MGDHGDHGQEFLGNLNGTRVAFGEAHACEGHDWKVFLEHIFMEARQGCLQAAQSTAMCALELHPATGRLWWSGPVYVAALAAVRW